MILGCTVNGRRGGEPRLEEPRFQYVVCNLTVRCHLHRTCFSFFSDFCPFFDNTWMYRKRPSRCLQELMTDNENKRRSVRWEADVAAAGEGKVGAALAVATPPPPQTNEIYTTPNDVRNDVVQRSTPGRQRWREIVDGRIVWNLFLFRSFFLPFPPHSTGVLSFDSNYRNDQRKPPCSKKNKQPTKWLALPLITTDSRAASRNGVGTKFFVKKKTKPTSFRGRPMENLIRVVSVTVLKALDSFFIFGWSNKLLWFGFQEDTRV